MARKVKNKRISLARKKMKEWENKGKFPILTTQIITIVIRFEKIYS